MFLFLICMIFRWIGRDERQQLINLSMTATNEFVVGSKSRSLWIHPFRSLHFEITSQSRHENLSEDDDGDLTMNYYPTNHKYTCKEFFERKWYFVLTSHRQSQQPMTLSTLNVLNWKISRVIMKNSKDFKPFIGAWEIEWELMGVAMDTKSNRNRYSPKITLNGYRFMSFNDCVSYGDYGESKRR